MGTSSFPARDVSLRGLRLLTTSSATKGTAFTDAEQASNRLEGLLPPSGREPSNFRRSVPCSNSDRRQPTLSGTSI